MGEVEARIGGWRGGFAGREKCALWSGDIKLVVRGAMDS